MGGGVGCDIVNVDTSISIKPANDPVRCIIDKYSVTIDNFIDYDPSSGKIKVVLTSIRNPNQGTINEGIKVFILSTASSA